MYTKIKYLLLYPPVSRYIMVRVTSLVYESIKNTLFYTAKSYIK